MVLFTAAVVAPDRISLIKKSEFCDNIKALLLMKMNCLRCNQIAIFLRRIILVPEVVQHITSDLRGQCNINVQLMSQSCQTFRSFQTFIFVGIVCGRFPKQNTMSHFVNRQHIILLLHANGGRHCCVPRDVLGG